MSEPRDLTIALVASDGSTFDGVLQVYDSRHNLIDQNDDDGVADYNSKVSLNLAADLTYYVSVAGFSSSIGAYNLLVGNGLGSDTAHAFSISLNAQGFGSQSGTIDQPAEVTTFQVVAPASGLMTVAQVSAPQASFIGTLSELDTSGTLVASQADAYMGLRPSTLGDNDELSSEMAEVIVSVTAGQTYLTRVSGVATSIGSFHLDLREFPASSQNLATQDLAQGVTAQQIVDTMLGPDNSTVQIVPGSVVYTGAPNAAGLFSGGSEILDSREAGASFGSGVVLTKGNASNIIGPNDNNAASETNGLPGSPLLEK